MRDATGSIELAVQLSGAGYQAGTNVNLADALRKKIEGDFAAAGAIAIPFDINFSDEEIFNRISAAMPEKTQEQIKGIVEEYKKWRDLQRDVYKQGITTISQLLGSAQDYETVVRKINTSLAAQKEAIDSMEQPDGRSDDEIFLNDYREYEAGSKKYGIGVINAYDDEAAKELALRMKNTLPSLHTPTGMDMLFAQISIFHDISNGFVTDI